MERRTLLETGLATSGARGRTAVRSCLCRVISGDRVSAEVPLGARPLSLGAGSDCDLVLDDPQVSRRHADLHLVPEGVRVRDLGSTNGTTWQGTRITDAVVPFGGQIRVGAAVIRFLTSDVPAVTPSERRRFAGMVGTSVAMRELFAVLELAAPTEATVLLEGESGTGKEMAARALHDHSARARVPLVVVDCSAISESLIDSHLFGHLRGAFTGAEAHRRGAFVEASGGTVFLDEIGELSLASQAKLLRVLGRARCSRSAATGRCRSTPGWSPPPTAIWPAWSRPSSSASTSSTGWRSCTSRSRRCASGRRTCRS
jgi:hypothetical protein